MIDADNGKAKKSFYTVIFLCILIVICFFNNPRQKNGLFRGEFQWDIFSYYMYLPFTFIYEDVGMQDRGRVEQIFKDYKIPGTYYQAYQIENGNYVPNYTLGFAMLWSPFFFVGHTWAKITDYPLDGWSFPYQASIACGVLLYILIGLFFLRKLLLRFFSDRLTALVILLIALGTNYFHEAFNDYMQPHAVLFGAYAIMLYCIVRWHETPAKKYVIGAGLVMGWMILARPSEILCILLPVLWNVYDKQSFRAKLDLIRRHPVHILYLVLFAFIPFIPQFIYWKVVTGSFIFFSYQHTEGFDFFQPHIINVLFSFKKSLFVYTPFVIFLIIGVIVLRKYNRPVFPAILVFSLANFYLLSSWAAWWNGGSYGMRYFVESYAVMTLPLGYALMDIQKRNGFIRGVAWLAMLFIVFLNLFQTWQYVHWIIPEDRMTFAYYKRIFLKTKVTDEDRKLMEVKRSYEATESFDNPHEYNHRTVAYYNFDDVNSGFFDESKKDTSRYLSPSHSYHMKGDDEWGPKYQIQYNHLVPWNKDHVWLKVSVSYYSEVDVTENDVNLVINMPHRDYNLKYRAYNFTKYPRKKGEWNTVTIDFMTPFPYSLKDHFDIYVWHRGKSDLWLDDFRIEAYHKK